MPGRPNSVCGPGRPFSTLPSADPRSALLQATSVRRWSRLAQQPYIFHTRPCPLCPEAKRRRAAPVRPSRTGRLVPAGRSTVPPRRPVRQSPAGGGPSPPEQLSLVVGLHGSERPRVLLHPAGLRLVPPVAAVAWVRLGDCSTERRFSYRAVRPPRFALCSPPWPPRWGGLLRRLACASRLRPFC